MLDEQEHQTIYKVVVNHEEQYSVWEAQRTHVGRGSKSKGWHSDSTAFPVTPRGFVEPVAELLLSP